jgi:hypothetical protein
MTVDSLISDEPDTDSDRPVQDPSHTPLTFIRVMQTRNLTSAPVLQPRHHRCITSTAPAAFGPTPFATASSWLICPTTLACSLRRAATQRKKTPKRTSSRSPAWRR